MYALLTLEILITLLLHIKLLEKKKENLLVLIEIGTTVIAGALTHYYYFLIIFILYLIFMAKYIKEKRIKEGIYYTVTIFMSLGISVIIYTTLLIDANVIDDINANTVAFFFVFFSPFKSLFKITYIKVVTKAYIKTFTAIPIHLEKCPQLISIAILNIK